jgi:hypothetical protein
MKGKGANYTVFIVLGLLALIVVSLIPYKLNLKVEQYEDQQKGSLNELIDRKKLAVFQGVSANTEISKSIEYDDDDTKPSVDGSLDGPRSLFMFAYNKVSPECCLGSRSSGYSTSGGCVCMTDKQKDYLEGAKSLENLDKCTFP